MQSERRINSLKSSLDEKEKELNTAAQKLQVALSASAASDTTIKQLEEAVQRYTNTQTHAVHTHMGLKDWSIYFILVDITSTNEYCEINCNIKLKR